MKTRPTSVAVIAWLTIVQCIWALAAIPIDWFWSHQFYYGSMPEEMWFRHPVPAFIQYSLSPFAVMAVLVGSSIGMLRGKSIARTIFTAWTLIGVIYIWGLWPTSFHETSWNLLFDQFIPPALTLLFLFLPRANRYFSKGDRKNEIQEEARGYDSLTVFLFVLGGNLLNIAFLLNIYPFVFKAFPSFFRAIALLIMGVVPLGGLALVFIALRRTQYRHWLRDMAVFLALLGFVIWPTKSPYPYFKTHKQAHQININSVVTPEDRYQKSEVELNAATTEEARFYALDGAAKASFDMGRYDEARRDATELEKLLPKYQKNWNCGNAIQDVNIVFGRLALCEGRVAVAKEHLLAAGKSPGSPQMDSFGPNMSLASDLLDKGEKEVVLQYFALCRAFWKMDYGKLDEWTRDIENDIKPDFGANLIY